MPTSHPSAHARAIIVSASPTADGSTAAPPPDEQRAFAPRAAALAARLRARAVVPPGAFDHLEDNPVFLAYARSLDRLDFLDRHQILPSEATTRVVRLLRDSLPLAPISDRDVILGLMAVAAIRPGDLRALGRASLGVDAWWLVRVLASLVASLALLIFLVRQSPGGYARVSSPAMSLEQVALTGVALGLLLLAGWLFQRCHEQRSFLRMLAFVRRATPVSIPADEALPELGRGLGRWAARASLAVVSGVVGAAVVLGALQWVDPDVGGQLLRAVFLLAGMAVGLALYLLLLPAPSFAAGEFRAVERRVAAWRARLVERQAADRGGDRADTAAG